jgi:uncharacterized membrane protein
LLLAACSSFEEVIMNAHFSYIAAIFLSMSTICIVNVYARQETPTFPDVERIFQARCVKCHSRARPPEGLHLDTYNGALAGSKDMKIIVKGDPGKSELVKRVKGISKPRMPKDGPP